MTRTSLAKRPANPSPQAPGITCAFRARMLWGTAPPQLRRRQRHEHAVRNTAQGRGSTHGEHSVTLSTVPADESTPVLDAARLAPRCVDQPASSPRSAVTKYKVEWFDADAIRWHEGGRDHHHLCARRPQSRGTFQIEYDGELTDHLDYDATGPSVQDALNGLSTLRHVKVHDRRSRMVAMCGPSRSRLMHRRLPARACSTCRWSK